MTGLDEHLLHFDCFAVVKHVAPLEAQCQCCTWEEDCDSVTEYDLRVENWTASGHIRLTVSPEVEQDNPARSHDKEDERDGRST